MWELKSAFLAHNCVGGLFGADVLMYSAVQLGLLIALPECAELRLREPRRAVAVGAASCLLLLLEQHIETQTTLGFWSFSCMTLLRENSGSHWVYDHGFIPEPVVSVFTSGPASLICWDLLACALDSMVLLRCRCECGWPL